MRRDGLLPGIVYSGGKRGPRLPGQRARGPRRDRARRRPARPRVRGRRLRCRSSSRSSSAIPFATSSCTSIFQEVDLEQAIESDVEIVLLGVEDAPGVKNDGGVLEHVTREVTVEALPTDIPESIAVDVSAMEIGDTLQLSAVTAPEGVSFVLGEDAEELTIATLSPPARRGRARARSRGRDRADRRGRRAHRGRAEDATASPATPAATTPATTTPPRSRRCPRCFAASGGEATMIRARGRFPHSRPRQSRQPLRADPPQRRLRGRSPSSPRRWDLPRAKDKFRGRLSRGPHPARRPARRAAAAADLHERVGPQRRPRPRLAADRARPR